MYCGKPFRPDEVTRPTPALALTAFPDEQARALASGFQAYLAKPIDPTLVVREVTRLAGTSPESLEPQ